jgi:hypothetical protein
MGVHGLKLYLTTAGACSSQEEKLQSGSVLVVDGNGWLFSVLDNANTLERQYGGSYMYLDQLIRAEIIRMLDMKLRLVFYIDGDESRMKNATAEKRRKRREEMWENVYNTTLDDTDGKIVQRDLAVPPLVINQLKSTLRALGMPVRICEYEADQDVARACMEGNQVEGNHYVYAGDRYADWLYSHDTLRPVINSIIFSDVSDFFAMKGCPYIEFGTIIDQRSSGGELTAPVWRREVLAKSLGMSESQFVEWCIFVGNDFTDHFGRRMFDAFIENSDSGANELPQGHNPDALDTLRRFIISKGGDVRMGARSLPALDQSISFSRAVYQLEDLSSYPETTVSDEEVMRLTKRQKDILYEWLQHHEPFTSLEGNSNPVDVHAANTSSRDGTKKRLNRLVATTLSPKDIAQCAWTFLCDMSRRTEIAFYQSENDEDDDSEEVSKLQLKALELMLSQLSSSSAGEESNAQRSRRFVVPKVMKPPRWEDICAANTYQLICREIMKGQPQASQAVSIMRTRC